LLAEPCKSAAKETKLMSAQEASTIIPFIRDKKFVDFKRDHVQMTHIDHNDPNNMPQPSLKNGWTSRWLAVDESKGHWDNNAAQSADASKLLAKFVLILKDAAKMGWLGPLQSRSVNQVCSQNQRPSGQLLNCGGRGW